MRLHWTGSGPEEVPWSGDASDGDEKVGEADAMVRQSWLGAAVAAVEHRRGEEVRAWMGRAVPRGAVDAAVVEIADRAVVGGEDAASCPGLAAWLHVAMDGGGGKGGGGEKVRADEDHKALGCVFVRCAMARLGCPIASTLHTFSFAVEARSRAATTQGTRGGLKAMKQLRSGLRPRMPLPWAL